MSFNFYCCASISFCLSQFLWCHVSYWWLLMKNRKKGGRAEQQMEKSNRGAAKIKFRNQYGIERTWLLRYWWFSFFLRLHFLCFVSQDEREKVFFFEVSSVSIFSQLQKFSSFLRWCRWKWDERTAESLLQRMRNGALSFRFFRLSITKAKGREETRQKRKTKLI